MLKIKDNINLKELEKFGFDQISSFWYAKNIFKDSGDTITISVNTETRGIQLSWSSYGNSIAYTYNLDVLFDLIKADLVEKVEEENVY